MKGAIAKAEELRDATPGLRSSSASSTTRPTRRSHRTTTGRRDLGGHRRQRRHLRGGHRHRRHDHRRRQVPQGAEPGRPDRRRRAGRVARSSTAAQHSPHKIQGIGAGFVPEHARHRRLRRGAHGRQRVLRSRPPGACPPPRASSSGISSGAALQAAVELAKRPENAGKRDRRPAARLRRPLPVDRARRGHSSSPWPPRTWPERPPRRLASPPGRSADGRRGVQQAGGLVEVGVAVEVGEDRPLGEQPHGLTHDHVGEVRRPARPRPGRSWPPASDPPRGSGRVDLGHLVAQDLLQLRLPGRPRPQLHDQRRLDVAAHHGARRSSRRRSPGDRSPRAGRRGSSPAARPRPPARPPARCRSCWRSGGRSCPAELPDSAMISEMDAAWTPSVRISRAAASTIVRFVGRLSPVDAARSRVALATLRHAFLLGVRKLQYVLARTIIRLLERSMPSHHPVPRPRHRLDDGQGRRAARRRRSSSATTAATTPTCAASCASCWPTSRRALPGTADLAGRASPVPAACTSPS